MNPAPIAHKHPRYRVHSDVDVLEADASLRRLPLENISLGGMFIKTLNPPAPGSSLRVRLLDPASDTTLGLSARVIHVIDEPTSVMKRHPAGMGVQYHDVSPHHAAQLRAFVERLATSAPSRPRTPSARFVDARVVVVDAGRAALHALWEQSLKVGGLFAEGQAPPLGATVEVRIGQLRLVAEVVHVQPGVGAGLQITDRDGAARAALLRYLAGGPAELPGSVPTSRGPPLHKVLAVVRQLFAGLETADGFAALGLPTSADEDEVRKRAASLKRIFSAPHPDATPPQAARIEGALRAIVRLEPALLARVAALRKEAELVPRPMAPSAPSAAPPPRPPRETLEAARAADALQKAEVFVKGLGMKDEAARLARVALDASPTREVRLRALGVLAKAGFVDEAATVGESLVAADQSDPLALQMLMHLYERTKQRVRAARAGEALLRLRPNDVELQKTVRRLIKAART